MTDTTNEMLTCNAEVPRVGNAAARKEIERPTGASKRLPSGGRGRLRGFAGVAYDLDDGAKPGAHLA